MLAPETLHTHDSPQFSSERRALPVSEILPARPPPEQMTDPESVLPEPQLTTTGGMRGWKGAGIATFAYINCLDREYADTKAKIERVVFDYSRFGSHKHTIHFTKDGVAQPVTEKAAITAAEAWLSEPLTEEHYEKIKHDLFHGYEWEDAKEVFGCRGECLTDSCYLEIAHFERGTLTLECGS